ncbi:non-homologous end-joining factor 1-like [Malaya genurostris]|uniref:non-homologous end-joining factor 1-like n=1 Tax=Malaya genurostris TaxID=325434 RepID=UPI0026F3A2AA|nr:non-homologous end-joining factor 1-like [Malaya genurostris]
MQEFLKINDKFYIVHIQRVNDREEQPSAAELLLQCSIFDMIQLWSETISITNLIEREKKNNAIIEYSPDIVDETLLARRADGYNLQESNDSSFEMCLNMKYYVSGIPVTFNLQLKQASREELSENILLPVWRTLLLLHEENCTLKDMLLKKDIEIEQYKVEGAILKRNLVATTKFDETKFCKTFPLSFPDQGLKVLELIKNKERRASLMKLLQIQFNESSAKQASPTKLSSTTALSPTKRSPGTRAKGLDALYAKQRIPKTLPSSFLSRKRLPLDLADEDDKKVIPRTDNTSFDVGKPNDSISELNGSRGSVKVRKITKL